MLPYDILEKIASYADIDSRRALGFKPRKLDRSFITKMNTLIERKYKCQYKGYPDIITALYPIEKNKACYIQYYNLTNSVSFTFYQGLIYLGDNFVCFNTSNIIRGQQYYIHNIFEPGYTISKSNGLGTSVTPYNRELFPA